MLKRRDFLALSGAGCAAWLSAGAFPGTGKKTETGKEATTMPYSAKDYSKLVGMPGFSETLLKNHFTLYQGYVANTNKVLDVLAQMLKDGKTGAPEYAELKRRLGWEFDGMRLHEYYFGNLGGKGGLPAGGVAAKVVADRDPDEPGHDAVPEKAKGKDADQFPAGRRVDR